MFEDHTGLASIFKSCVIKKNSGLMHAHRTDRVENLVLMIVLRLIAL